VQFCTFQYELNSSPFSFFQQRMSRSRYTVNSLIKKKFRDNFRVYLERAHPAFLTTLVVVVFNNCNFKTYEAAGALGKFLNVHLALSSKSVISLRFILLVSFFKSFVPTSKILSTLPAIEVLQEK